MRYGRPDSVPPVLRLILPPHRVPPSKRMAGTGKPRLTSAVKHSWGEA